MKDSMSSCCSAQRWGDGRNGGKAKKTFYIGDFPTTGRRQPLPCPRMQTGIEGGRRKENSPGMASSCRRPRPIIFSCLGFLLLASVVAVADPSSPAANSTFRAREELAKMRRIRAHLKRLNKPSVKTIQVCRWAFWPLLPGSPLLSGNLMRRVVIFASLLRL